MTVTFTVKIDFKPTTTLEQAEDYLRRLWYAAQAIPLKDIHNGWQASSYWKESS